MGLRANKQTSQAIRVGLHALKEAGTTDIRRERRLGKDFLIVPVVALTETVLQCVTCPEPEFAPADEFAKDPDHWNGLPVTYTHPQDATGTYISARAAAAKKFLIGRIEAARREDKSLRMEAAIDVELAEKAGAGELLERLENGDRVEVSTGFYCDTTAAEGEVDGKRFAAVQHGHVGDHLAFLTAADLGACSWDQGCGAPRAAKEADLKHRMNCAAGAACTCKKGELEPAEAARRLQSLEAIVGTSLKGNAVSDTDLRNSLEQALRKANPDDGWLYVWTVFPDAVVYEREGKLYRESYTLQNEEDGTVTLSGDATPVRPITRFVDAKQADGGDEPTDAKEAKAMKDKERKDLVAKLVAAKKLQGDAAKKYEAALGKLDDDTLTTLSEGVEEPKVEPKKDEPKEPEKKPAEGAAPAAEGAAPTTLKGLEGLTPDSVRWLASFAASQRTKFVDQIKASSRSKFNDEQLAKMDIETLGTLAESLSDSKLNANGGAGDGSTASYLGLGGPRGHESGDEVDPLKANVNSTKLEDTIRVLRGGKAAA